MTLRILLTVPMNRPSDVEFSLNDNGLAYIAASCKKIGVKDTTLLSWNLNLNSITFRQKLIELNPNLVGIKVFTTFFKQVYDMLCIVRTTLPDAITIIGGPHPSTTKPEVIFEEFNGLVDFAISGDGEVGIAELVRNIQSYGRQISEDNLQNIPGLIYQINKKTKFNKPYFNSELESLPIIDWSIQKPSQFYYGLKSARGNSGKNPGFSALILDSRGCIAKCGHCMAWKINGSKIRKRDLDSLCVEIQELIKKFRVRVLEFTGNGFLSNTDYVQDLCQWIISKNISANWGCTGAAFCNNLDNSKLLKLMKKAGCNAIHFGIESGNRRILKMINKPFSLEQYSAFVNKVTKSGINAIGYFMFGFPDETVQEMNDTIKFALSLPFHSIYYCICLPLPGTSSYNSILNQKNISRMDWQTFNFSKPNLLPCKASPKIANLKILETKVLKRSSIARRFYNIIH